jgi:hypothetical protein
MIGVGSMSQIPLDARATENWHRLDVRCWHALARTSVSMIGVLDTKAVEEIDLAVRTAEERQHSLVLNLEQISSVTPQAMNELLTRGRWPRVTAA